MADVKEIEVHVAMDSDGDAVAWIGDASDAVSIFEDNVGGVSVALRVATLKVSMRPPECVTADVTVLDSAGEVITATA